MSSLLSNPPLSKVFAVLLASGLWATAFAAPSDDPYGIGSPSAPVVVPDTTKPATGSVQADTTSAPAAAAVTPDTVPAPKTPRAKITRETTVNPMDVHRGSYRNPKKALFMSLVIPGLGQAYIGQSKFNYIRAAVYLTADVTMGLAWYQYSVVKYDKKVTQYRNYADLHWSQAAYESKITDMVGTVTEQARFEKFNPNRTSYCQAVQSNEGAGVPLYEGCLIPYSQVPGDGEKYTNFKTTFNGDVPGAVTGARRDGFPDPVAFYEMIGANQEFLYGWDDPAADPSVVAGSSNPGYDLNDTTWVGVSAHRDAYNAMRQTAKDYSRMQTWFLGGIVLNHIASAIDAALTARRHNRILYEDGGASWYDKINLDGGMAFDQGRPRTHMMAYLSF